MQTKVYFWSTKHKKHIDS